MSMCLCLGEKGRARAKEHTRESERERERARIDRQELVAAMDGVHTIHGATIHSDTIL